MAAPDMRAHVKELVGTTVSTVARDRPNTIVKVTGRRVLIETDDGHQNYASLRELQDLADRVFAGEEVEVPLRGRSAFHMAILAGLPGVDFALNPRRVWLKPPPTAFDVEHDELFPDRDPAGAREGRIVYRQHRLRERSPVLRRLKTQEAMEEHGRLACEACGFDYAERYGTLGEGFIECHHKTALAEGAVRETVLDDLALLCASCHRMIHRSDPMVTVEELRERLGSPADL
jgi:hypothetical protein